MEPDFGKIQKERLPTLYEVLIQKTSAPVDLWSFYTFLSQFPFAINYLDFWIDLMAHMRLCKDYIEGIRRSLNSGIGNGNGTGTGRNTSNSRIPHDRVNANANTSGDDNLDADNVSVTTSVLINALMEEGHLDFQDPSRVSQFLRGDSADYTPQLTQMLESWKRHSGIYDPNNLNALNIDNMNLATLMDEVLKKQTQVRHDTAQITTKQLQNNALQICNTYLLSPEKSPRYLTNIPGDIRQQTVNLITNQHRHDPEVFENLKTLTYQFLEIDCFPKFLSRVALHNIHDEISDWRFQTLGRRTTNNSIGNIRTRNRNSQHNITSIRYQGSRSPFSNYTTLSRTVFGLICLGIGFWIGYVLIFLEYSRAIRVVTVVPFAIGSYFIICGLYQVDIIYSWLGVTQKLTFREDDFDRSSDSGSDNESYDLEKRQRVRSSSLPMSHSHSQSSPKGVPFILVFFGGRGRVIKVRHPFIRGLLFKRGLWCCLLVVILSAVFTVVFSCVPGYRV